MSFKNLSGFKFEREVSVDPYIPLVDRRFYMSCRRETVGCRRFDRYKQYFSPEVYFGIF